MDSMLPSGQVLAAFIPARLQHQRGVPVSAALDAMAVVYE